MATSYQRAIAAIKARRDGVYDDPALVSYGPLLPNEEEDVTWIKRRYLVDVCGFKIGPRDPRLNTDYPGRWMVCEEDPDGGGCELPTRDGANGPWCIVGDDMPELINQAFDCWADEDHCRDAEVA